MHGWWNFGVAERVTFDTNVFWHGMLPSSDPVAPTCRRLVRAADDGDLDVWCSTLVLVELPKVLAPDYPIGTLVSLTENLRSSAVNWVPVTESIAMKARELSLERSIAPAYDAVMLATAIEVGATTLMTYDRDDLPVDQTIDEVMVRTPFLPAGLAQDEIPGLDVGTGTSK